MKLVVYFRTIFVFCLSELIPIATDILDLTGYVPNENNRRTIQSSEDKLLETSSPPTDMSSPSIPPPLPNSFQPPSLNSASSTSCYNKSGKLNLKFLQDYHLTKIKN